LSSSLGFMFFLETFSPTLATLILTVFKTTQVVLPTLICRLTLLEPFSYFTYGVIDVPLPFRDNFFSIQSVLHHIWTSTIEVSIATWDMI
jgi:hypothetical protein